MRIPRLVCQVLLLLTVGTHVTRCATTSLLEVPFKLYEGFAMVVKGSIGDQAGLNFLVDTGAVPTAVHERLALKLRVHGKLEAIAIGGRTASVERVQVRELRLGTTTEDRTVSAVVIDLEPIEARLRVRLDAIIGLDVLGTQDFTIDYREKKIRFGPPSPSGQAVPFELRYQAGAPYVVVPCEINSETMSLLLDTGNDSLTLFRMKSEASGRRKVRSGQTVDAGGSHLTERAEVRSVRFGPSEWSGVAATFVTSVDASAQRDFDGMLGPVSLGMTQIGFDFTIKTMFVNFKR